MIDAEKNAEGVQLEGRQWRCPGCDYSHRQAGFVLSHIKRAHEVVDVDQ
jgi:hypothetical protein